MATSFFFAEIGLDVGFTDDAQPTPVDRDDPVAILMRREELLEQHTYYEVTLYLIDLTTRSSK